MSDLDWLAVLFFGCLFFGKLYFKFLEWIGSSIGAIIRFCGVRRKARLARRSVDPSPKEPGLTHD